VIREERIRRRFPIIAHILLPLEEEALELEKIITHEFSVTPYRTDTSYSLSVPFRKSVVPFSLSGEFDETVTTDLDVIEGHGRMRPSKIRKYRYAYVAREKGILKSCSSRHCKTTITVRGRTYVCEDGVRTFNVSLRRGDRVSFVFENPTMMLRVGVSNTIIEYAGATYENITQELKVS